jgi:hypothetical protein
MLFMLVGDFNFDANLPASTGRKRDEAASIPTEYADCWSYVHNERRTKYEEERTEDEEGSLGATMPFDDVTGGSTRIDRVLLCNGKGSDGSGSDGRNHGTNRSRYEAVAITRVGMAGIGIPAASADAQRPLVLIVTDGGVQLTLAPAEGCASEAGHEDAGGAGKIHSDGQERPSDHHRLLEGIARRV